MNNKHKYWQILSDWRLLLYNLAIVAGSGFFLLRKWRRALSRKSDWEFDPMRWHCPVWPGQEAASTPSQTQEEQPVHVVFISAGFGEMRTIEQLATALQQERPDVKTTWALRRRETLKIIQREHPEQAVAFMPFDCIIPVSNWLRHLSPDVVVVVEKLFIPNVIWGSANWGANVLVVNGRSGERPGKKWKSPVQRLVQRWSLTGFDSICLQSNEELRKIETILPAEAKVQITGSMKFESWNARSLSPSDDLRRWVEINASLPILVAGSTHADEVSLILEAFKAVRQHTPCCLLIAPRHLNEVDDLITILQSAGIKSISRRSAFSADERGSAPAEVLVLDTLGELAQAYSFARGAYVGGTLHGAGHNVTEPLEWGVPVAFGVAWRNEKIGRPTPVQKMCMDAGVGFRVKDADELAAHWLRILQDESFREETSIKASQILQEQRGALQKNIEAIVTSIDQRASLHSK